MKTKELPVILIAAFIFVLNLSFLYLKDIGGFSYDTGNFLFSIFHYDLTQDAPHLPGYPLYVFSLKIAYTILKNPYFSYKMVNLFFSFLTFLTVFLSFRIQFNFAESINLTLFLFSIPYILFFHLLPETYVFDLLYATFIFFIMHKTKKPELIGFAYGFLAGFRPASLLLLFPFYATLFFCKYKKAGKIFFLWLRSVSGIFIGFGLWFIPMVISLGGVRPYLNLYISNNPMEPLSLLQNFSRFILYSWTLLLVIVVFVFFLIPRKSRNAILNFGDILPHLIFLITALFFFAFIHFSKGYALIIGFSTVYLVGVLWQTSGMNLHILRFWIIAHVLFFFMMPYRIPSPDCYRHSSVRTENPLQIAWESAFSFYLTAYSHIRYLEDSFEEISSAIQANPMDSKRVFIGPMIPVSIRNLAFAFPDIYFYRLRPGHSLIPERYHFNTKSLSSDTTIRNLLIVIRNDNLVQSKLSGLPVFQGKIVSGILIKQIQLEKLTLWHYRWLGR